MAASRTGLFFANVVTRNIEFIGLNDTRPTDPADPVDTTGPATRERTMRFTSLPVSLPYELLTKSNHVTVASLTYDNHDTLYIALKLVHFSFAAAVTLV